MTTTRSRWVNIPTLLLEESPCSERPSFSSLSSAPRRRSPQSSRLILVLVGRGPDAHTRAGRAAGAAAGERRGLTPAPNRRSDEGRGPFKSLVIRGVMLIDGTGAPPQGPVDIVVSGNRIASVRSAGTPGLALRTNRAPQNAELEVDATGMYVMPGFIDMHVHAGGAPKNAEAEYAYKLWLGHGITTVRGVPLGSFEFSKAEQGRSARNEIVAPRIMNYQRPGSGSGWTGGPIATPNRRASGRAGPRNRASTDSRSMRTIADIMAALIDEAKKLGLERLHTSRRSGVGADECNRRGASRTWHCHAFYGLFESMLKDYTVQPWPVNCNYNDEADRFGQVARLWDKIHPPGSEQWKSLVAEFVKLGTALDPTMTIYAAGRDLMGARNAEWRAKYTLPSM